MDSSNFVCNILFGNFDSPESGFDEVSRFPNEKSLKQINKKNHSTN
jgi:hypothetical protein